MNSCRLCNSSFIRNWTAKDAKTGETLQMALCGGCGLVQQSTLPTDEELKAENLLFPQLSGRLQINPPAKAQVCLSCWACGQGSFSLY